jgi:hypothetical protein
VEIYYESIVFYWGYIIHVVFFLVWCVFSFGCFAFDGIVEKWIHLNLCPFHFLGNSNYWVWFFLAMSLVSSIVKQFQCIFIPYPQSLKIFKLGLPKSKMPTPTKGFIFQNTPLFFLFFSHYKGRASYSFFTWSCFTYWLFSHILHTCMCETTPSSKSVKSFHLDVSTHVCTFIQVKQLDRFEQGIIWLGTRWNLLNLYKSCGKNVSGKSIKKMLWPMKYLFVWEKDNYFMQCIRWKWLKNERL